MEKPFTDAQIQDLPLLLSLIVFLAFEAELDADSCVRNIQNTLREFGMAKNQDYIERFKAIMHAIHSNKRYTVREPSSMSAPRHTSEL